MVENTNKKPEEKASGSFEQLVDIDEPKETTNNSTKKSETKTSRKIPFAIVESYKKLRTSISFLLSETGGNSFTVTSANAGEGKSTTSANLAVAFSQLGKKVLIIDADLRKASLHKKFKIENSLGLSDVILENCQFSDALKKINPVLDVLTAGTLPPNPSELLDSKAFEDLMVYFSSIYDFVIVDTPPLNVVSDSLIVAPKTSGVVLVVRDAYTPHFSIKKAIEIMRFSNVNILGAVMNGSNPTSKKKYVYRKSYNSFDYSYYNGRGGYKYGTSYNGYSGGYSGYSGYSGYGGYGGYNSYAPYGYDRTPTPPMPPENNEEKQK